MPLAIHVKTYLGLDYAFANNLEISSDGKLLTGKLEGTIVNGQKKADFLRVISQLEHIPKEQVRYSIELAQFRFSYILLIFL